MVAHLTAFDFNGKPPLTTRLRPRRSTIGFADGCTFRLPLDATCSIPPAKLKQTIADITVNDKENSCSLSGSFERLEVGSRSKHLLFGSVPNFPCWAGWNPKYENFDFKLEDGENIFFLVFNDTAPQRFRLAAHVQLKIVKDSDRAVRCSSHALPEESMLAVLSHMPVGSLATVIPAVCCEYNDLAVGKGFCGRDIRVRVEFSYASQFLRRIFKGSSKVLEFCDNTPARSTVGVCTAAQWEVELQDWFHSDIQRARVKAHRLKFMDSLPSAPDMFSGLTDLEIDDSCLLGLGDNLPLSRMTNLRKLSISSGHRVLSDMQERVLVDIEDLEHLEDLSVLGYVYVLQRAWLSFMDNLKADLRRLVLINCVQITDEVLMAIARKFPALERLMLTGNPRLSPSLVETVAKSVGSLHHKKLLMTRTMSYDNVHIGT